MKHLKFFFDPISPYAYFAIKTLNPLAVKYGITVHSVPILFAGLLNKHGQKGPAEIPSKRSYTFLDCIRKGEAAGIPFQIPPTHPFKPLLPLRTLTAVSNENARLMLSECILDACWGLGLDISAEATLRNLLIKNGFDADSILTMAHAETTKESLKNQTENAINTYGVFGVPTIVIDDQLFWGSDRMDLLELYLQGKLSKNTEKLKVFLDRPRGADRKQFKNSFHPNA